MHIELWAASAKQPKAHVSKGRAVTYAVEVQVFVIARESFILVDGERLVVG